MELRLPVSPVHMNGRVYDPDLGRFISADPYVQYPMISQNYNRYTYVDNNPLSYTDPSGFFMFGQYYGDAYDNFNDYGSYNYDFNSSIGFFAGDSYSSLDYSATFGFEGDNVFVTTYDAGYSLTYYFDTGSYQLGSYSQYPTNGGGAGVAENPFGGIAFTGESIQVAVNTRCAGGFGGCNNGGSSVGGGSVEKFGGARGMLGNAFNGALLKKLPKPLRNKMKRIKNQTAAGGNRSVSGSVSSNGAIRLGQEFVGPGFKSTTLQDGTRVFISRDGLRQFRGPTQKSGINPNTGEPFSRTGIQVNFESRVKSSGRFTNNVHLDVVP